MKLNDKKSSLLRRFRLGLLLLASAFALQACYVDTNDTYCYDGYYAVDCNYTQCYDYYDYWGYISTDCQQYCQEIWVDGYCESVPQCYTDMDCSYRGKSGICDFGRCQYGHTRPDNPSTNPPSDNPGNNPPSDNPGSNQDNDSKLSKYSCVTANDCAQYNLGICVAYSTDSSLCEMSCLTDSHCPSNRYCEYLDNAMDTGACISQKYDCASSNDCNEGGISGMVCSNGRCKVGCQNNDDCRVTFNGQSANVVCRSDGYCDVL